MEFDDVQEVITKLYNIEPLQVSMTFYYDETGNCGKFILNEKGINDEKALSHDFILGGVAFIGNKNPSNPEDLILKLKINSKELKLKNIYLSKDFFTSMRGEKITTFIDWLYNSDLYIHYATLNNLYFSLVDMVDSLWETQKEFFISQNWIFQIKSALYSFCKKHLGEVLNLLYQYKYPNIQKVKIESFGIDFCNLISTYNDDETPEVFFVECFRQMLKFASKQGKLSFLCDNKDNVMIEEYYSIYQGRCQLLANSKHYFDYEKNIIKKMKECEQLSDDANIINYKFLNSKQDRMIQISDVVVGLLGKVFFFLDNLTYEDIINLMNKENKNILNNLAKLNYIINKSNKLSELMIQNINDIKIIDDRMNKLEMLVRYVKI